MFWASLLATAIFAGARVSALTPMPGELQGWYSESGTWSPVSCNPGQTYVQSSTYGRCCTDIHSNCDFATSCYPSTILTSGITSGHYTCPQNQTCAVRTIYESETTGPSYLDFFCYDDTLVAYTVFQITDAGSTTTAGTNTATAAPGTSVTAAVASATSTSENTAQSSENSGSKGWIAGAVVGPVAGCAIIAALAFWLIRRSLAKRQANVPNTGELDYTNTQAQSGIVSELGPGAPKPHEMDPSATVSELPAPTGQSYTGHSG